MGKARLIKKGQEPQTKPPVVKVESAEQRIAQLRNDWVTEHRMRQETQRQGVGKWLKS